MQVNEFGLITRSQAASIINTEWYYSMHWPEKDWEDTAYTDAVARLGDTLNEVQKLKEVIRYLKKGVAINKEYRDLENTNKE